MTSEEFGEKYSGIIDRMFSAIPNVMGHDIGMDGALAIARAWQMSTPTSEMIADLESVEIKW